MKTNELDKKYFRTQELFFFSLSQQKKQSVRPSSELLAASNLGQDESGIAILEEEKMLMPGPVYFSVLESMMLQTLSFLKFSTLSIITG